MPPHPLPNFEIQKFHQNEPKFNGVYSRNNLSKIETHWIALYATGRNVTDFDSFGVEYIPKEIRKFIGNKNIITSIYRIQAYDSIMRGYFCIGFIDFMLKGKTLLEYTNLFSSNEYKKNHKIILKYFQYNLNRLKL